MHYRPLLFLPSPPLLCLFSSRSHVNRFPSLLSPILCFFFFFVFEIMASFKVRNYRGILENWIPSTSSGAPSFASSPKWRRDEHSLGVFGPSPVSHKKTRELVITCEGTFMLRFLFFSGVASPFCICFLCLPWHERNHWPAAVEILCTLNKKHMILLPLFSCIIEIIRMSKLS